MSHSLELDFVTPVKEMPSPPRARIYIKTCSSDMKGLSYITPDCVSFAEFEEQINRLQKELDEIRGKAKKRFAALRKSSYVTGL